jgi:hypothetical protein
MSHSTHSLPQSTSRAAGMQYQGPACLLPCAMGSRAHIHCPAIVRAFCVPPEPGGQAQHISHRDGSAILCGTLASPRAHQGERDYRSLALPPTFYIRLQKARTAGQVHNPLPSFSPEGQTHVYLPSHTNTLRDDALCHALHCLCGYGGGPHAHF